MIREIEEKDIPEVLSLLEEVLKVHNRLYPDLFKDKGSKYDGEEIRQIMKKESKKIFVYVEDNNVLGHIFVELKEYPETLHEYMHKELYIDDLCVKKEKRRQGIASRLYDYVKEYAKSVGCDRITLNVYCKNDAYEFYKNLGLKERKVLMEEKL